MSGAQKPIVGELTMEQRRERSLKQLSQQVGLMREQLRTEKQAIAAFPAPWRGHVYVILADALKGGKQYLLRFFVQNGEHWTLVPDSPQVQCLRRNLEQAVQKMYVFYANIESWYVDPLCPGTRQTEEDRT
jgi:hypothetical protein